MTENKHEPVALTVSVVVYDSPDAHLQALLASLVTALQQARDAGLAPSARLLLVDNSPACRLRLERFDGFRAALQSLNTELRLLQGHGNIGFGAGHNLAIRAAAGDYLLVLNPDVELAPDSLRVGLAYLAANPGVAIVVPQARDQAGNRQYLCKRQPSLLVLLARGFFPAWLRRPLRARLHHYEMRDLDDARPADTVPIASGCCMLCRTSALQAAGGFDENYFMYFEDFDLSLRIGKAARIAYLPAMQIVHHGGNSATKGLRHIRMFLRSGWRFFNTWGWRFIQ